MSAFIELKCDMCEESDDSYPYRGREETEWPECDHWAVFGNGKCLCPDCATREFDTVRQQKAYQEEVSRLFDLDLD